MHRRPLLQILILLAIGLAALQPALALAPTPRPPAAGSPFSQSLPFTGGPGGAGEGEGGRGVGVRASTELRGFWVDAWNAGIKTPAQVSQLIADAHTANVNALFVQVRRRGDSYYSKSVEPRASDIPDPAFDPLASLVQAAHDAAPPLQVYAWVVTFPVWSSDYTTTDSLRHVYYRHGCGSGCSWSDPENWISYGYDGITLTASYDLDPGHPAAARYTVDVCLYLARHYDIDGLVLDYVRYQENYGGVYYGYNKVSVDRFNAAYGRSGLPAPDDADWQEWRREQVTAVVRRLYLEALAVKPDLVVAAATIAWGDGPGQTGGWTSTSAYKRVFQNWRDWLQEGILDLAVPMNYDREHNDTERPYFDHWIEWEKDHQYGRGVAVAPGAFLNYIGGSLTQAAEVQAPSPAGNSALGMAFYSYTTTNAGGQPNSEFYNALSHTNPYGDPPFPTWADPPALAWKTTPTAGHLMGWAIGPAGPLSRVDVTLAGPTSRTLRTDGNGFFGAVDLAPGDYTLTLPAPATSPLYATVTAGRVSIATVAPPAAEPALRAVLVDVAQDGLKNPDQVDVLLSDARAAHLNAVIVQVREDGQIYYDSSFEPRTDDPALAAGFDPLAYLVQQAHGGDPALAVYASLPLLAVWDQDTAPAAPGHVYNLHPEWLTQDVNGNQRSYGEYFLDPGHPGALSYSVALVMDLLSRYSLDGLFLDRLYYPYQGSTNGHPLWGYNPTAVQRFHARYGGSGDPVPEDPQWMAWRREQLSALLRQVYLRSTDLYPRLRIAVAATAWGDSPELAGWEQSSAYSRLLQDWHGWLEEGIVDLAAPQNYDREYNADQQTWYDRWLAWEDSHHYNRGVLVLQGAYLNYPEDSLAQAGRVPGEAVGFASYIPANPYADPRGNNRDPQPPRQPWYYSPQAEWWLWRALATPYGYTDPANGAFTATMPIFPGTVPTPTLAWKDAPTLGHAAGWALGPGSLPLDGVTVTLGGPAVRTLSSDGQGFFGAVDLPPGSYLATVDGADPAHRFLMGTVAAGRVTWLQPCYAVSGLLVSGPGALLVGQLGTYQAVVQPITASLPITFAWDSGAAGPTATYSWATTGTYTLAVTATNACGTQHAALAVQVLTEWPYSMALPLVLRQW